MDGRMRSRLQWMAECGVDSSVPGHPQTVAGKGIDHRLEVRSNVAP